MHGRAERGADQHERLTAETEFERLLPCRHVVSRGPAVVGNADDAMRAPALTNGTDCNTPDSTRC